MLQAQMDRPDSNPAASAEETPRTGPGKLVLDEPANAAASELSEDQVLALLKRSDVTAAALALLGRNPSVIRSRKVLLALVTHPRTPRHITIPMLRRLFTFDLMQVALTPTVAADVKRAAEEQILNRLESLSSGERISLARRASGRVAAALLFDAEVRVISMALDNSRLVEASLVTALMKHSAPESLFAIASEHPKWSLRREVQIALLRSEKLALQRAVELARNFSTAMLRAIMPESRREALIQLISPSPTGDPPSGGPK
jgi:hypothetical protein